MRIGILKESKAQEARVALTPGHVAKLVRCGQIVSVTCGAGALSGFADTEFRRAGAKMLPDNQAVIEQAELILKVKEPTSLELSWMNPAQTLFCYLHLAALPALTKIILEKKITAIGYETVELVSGALPLLKPMSEVAGKMAVQNGAYLLRADQGGRGILMGGTETVAPATVIILGGGVVGAAAASVALGMGAQVHIVDVNQKRLRALQKILGRRLHVHLSSRSVIQKLVKRADLLIGAVLLSGKKAPTLVMTSDVKKMKRGSVIIDVAVDQGGCIETSEVTSHAHPVVLKYGVLHYGVPNIPGSVPLTSTMALANATFPYVLKMASLGVERALKKIPELARAVNCARGEIVHPGLTRPIPGMFVARLAGVAVGQGRRVKKAGDIVVTMSRTF